MALEEFKSAWQKQPLDDYPLVGSRPVDPRESAFDALGRTAVITAFLAFTWRRAKSRSREIHRELERYLKDLER